MTTVPRPEGTITVRSGAGITVGGSGNTAARQMPPDYVPPGTPNLWLDTGSADGSVPRGDARVFPARVGGTSFVVDAGNGIGRTNAQNVVTVGSAADGLVGEWGPLTASWTVSLLVRLERPITTVGNYIGTGGTVTLLSCPSLGITVNLPSGGSVPSGACRANGGILDGAAPGDPWDLVCVGVWRTVFVRNDANNNVRTVSIGGYDVVTSTASTSPVPAHTTLRIGPGAPTLSVAELVVWDGLPLSDADRIATQTVQRLKWAVPAVLPDASVAVAAPPAPSGLLSVAVATLPEACGAAPSAWWDAANAGSLWADLGGTTTPAVGNGRVRCWRSRGSAGSGLAITFPDPAQALWLGDPASTVGGLPVVVLAAGGSGVYAAGNPFAGLGVGPFTAVAVWRLPASGTAGGHPLCLGGASAVGLAGWSDYIGTAVTMPTLATLGATAGSVLLVCWERDASGYVRYRLNTVDDTHGGHVWTSAASQTASVLWQSAAATVAGPLGGLAELLLWGRTLAAGERTALLGYLATRWGLTVAAAGTVPTTAVLPLLNPPLDRRFDVSAATTVLTAANTTANVGDAATHLTDVQGSSATFVVDYTTPPTPLVVQDGLRALRWPRNCNWAYFTGSAFDITGKWVLVAFSLPPVGQSVGTAVFTQNQIRMLYEGLAWISDMRYVGLGGGLDIGPASGFRVGDRVVLAFMVTSPAPTYRTLRFVRPGDSTITDAATTYGGSMSITRFKFIHYDADSTYVDLHEFQLREFSSDGDVIAAVQALRAKWTPPVTPGFTYDNVSDPDYVAYRWDAQSALNVLRGADGSTAVLTDGSVVAFWDEARTSRATDWRMGGRSATWVLPSLTPGTRGPANATLVMHAGNRPGVRLPWGAGMTTMVTNKPVPWGRTVFLVYRLWSKVVGTYTSNGLPYYGYQNIVDMSDNLDLITNDEYPVQVGVSTTKATGNHLWRILIGGNTTDYGQGVMLYDVQRQGNDTSPFAEPLRYRLKNNVDPADMGQALGSLIVAGYTVEQTNSTTITLRHIRTTGAVTATVMNDFGTGGAPTPSLTEQSRTTVRWTLGGSFATQSGASMVIPYYAHPSDTTVHEFLVCTRRLTDAEMVAERDRLLAKWS